MRAPLLTLLLVAGCCEAPTSTRPGVAAAQCRAVLSAVCAGSHACDPASSNEDTCANADAICAQNETVLADTVLDNCVRQAQQWSCPGGRFTLPDVARECFSVVTSGDQNGS